MSFFLKISLLELISNVPLFECTLAFLNNFSLTLLLLLILYNQQASPTFMKFKTYFLVNLVQIWSKNCF